VATVRANKLRIRVATVVSLPCGVAFFALANEKTVSVCPEPWMCLLTLFGNLPMRRSAGEAARAKPAERPGRLHCGDGHTVPKYRNRRSEGAVPLGKNQWVVASDWV
jgi:hypothetical protein